MKHGDKITIDGTIVSFTHPAPDQHQLFRVGVDCEHGPMMLLFIGRSSLACLDIGQHIRAAGRVCFYDGAPALYNPDYTIIPEERE